MTAAKSTYNIMVVDRRPLQEDEDEEDDEEDLLSSRRWNMFLLSLRPFGVATAIEMVTENMNPPPLRRAGSLLG